MDVVQLSVDVYVAVLVASKVVYAEWFHEFVECSPAVAATQVATLLQLVAATKVNYLTF